MGHAGLQLCQEPSPWMVQLTQLCTDVLLFTVVALTTAPPRHSVCDRWVACVMFDGAGTGGQPGMPE